jgi:hypothetical protein
LYGSTGCKRLSCAKELGTLRITVSIGPPSGELMHEEGRLSFASGKMPAVSSCNSELLLNRAPGVS